MAFLAWSIALVWSKVVLPPEKLLIRFLSVGAIASFHGSDTNRSPWSFHFPRRSVICPIGPILAPSCFSILTSSFNRSSDDTSPSGPRFIPRSCMYFQMVSMSQLSKLPRTSGATRESLSRSTSRCWAPIAWFTFLRNGSPALSIVLRALVSSPAIPNGPPTASISRPLSLGPNSANCCLSRSSALWGRDS